MHTKLGSLGATLLLAVLSLNLQAATWYWDGGTLNTNAASDNVTTSGQNWLSGGNWDNGTTDGPLASWTAGDSAVFGGSAASQTITASTLTIGNMTFGAGEDGSGTSGTAYTISGGTLTLNNTVITVNTATTIGSLLAGSSSLTKAGTGTLTLSVSNTYAGSTTLNAGTVQLNRPGTISHSGTTTVNSNSKLQLNSNGATWAANLFSSNINLNGGTLALTANSGSGQYITGVGASNVLGASSFITVHAGSVGAPNATSLFLDNGLTGSGTVAISSDTSGIGVCLRNNNTSFSGTLIVNGNATTTSGSGSGLTVGSVPTQPTLTNADLQINATMEMGNTGMGWANGTVNALTLAIGALNGTGVVIANSSPASATRALMVGGNNHDGTFSGVLADGANDTLSLTKTGTGTQVLSGANTYTGATTVSGGTLLVNGSLASGSAVTVQTNGTLSGGGTVGGVATVNGTLAPGTSLPGVLTINGNLVLASTTTNLFRLNKGGISDQVAGSGTVTCGGMLIVVSNANNAAFAPDDSFQLFTKTIVGGGFAAISLPPLDPSLKWVTNSLLANGTISVASAVAGSQPVFNPPGGAYVGAQSVVITSDPAATIHYTTDGSTPTSGSPVYSGPITVPAPTASMTINAYATWSGYSNSPVSSATYATVVTPAWINPAGGSWAVSGNWSNGVVSGGIGATADFTTLALPGSTTVTLDGVQIAGTLLLDDQNSAKNRWTLAAGAGGLLTLAVSTGSPMLSNNTPVTIGAVLQGAQGFTKGGTSTLTLTNANTYTGNTFVNAGTLAYQTTMGNNSTTFSGSGTVLLGAGVTGVNNNASFGSSFTGWLDLESGASLSAINSFSFTNNLGSLNVGAGTTLDINGSSVQFDGLTGSGVIANAAVATYAPATLMIGVNNASGSFSGQITSSSAINGAISLVKTGTGTQTLAGQNTYTGTTTVNDGTLQVDGAIGTGAVSVQANSTLAGAGSVNGAVTVQSGGTLSPGNTNMGTLTIANSLALAGNARFRIDNTSGTLTSDQVSGVSSLTYGGTLTVTNITSNGTPLAAGNQVQLFNAASASGTFSALNLPPLDSGLAWYWAPASGTLSVINVTNPPRDYVLYVSPAGNDATGDGSFSNPWKTVETARDYIRGLGRNPATTGDITVYLRGGRYQLGQTLAFTSADSAGPDHYITYKSYPGEQARLSGGQLVTGWTPVSGKPYWVASVSTNAGFADYFRQLYVNGIRAERAHSDWVTNTGVFDDPATPQAVDGVTFNPANFKPYTRVTDLRMLHIGTFKVDEFPVTSITTNSATGSIQVALQQPYCQARYYNGNSSDPNWLVAINQWMVIQAFEELNEPGEWYLDRTTQQVYYYPYSFEDMTTAEVYAPVVETLLSLTGDSTTNKVQNLRFENLLFEHGNWSFPRDYYIGGTQAEILMPALPPNYTNTVPYGYEVPGQVQLNNTEGIQFFGNTFQHLASCGIQPFNGARDTLIQSNLFYDLTGAAVLGGRWGGDASIPNQEICTNTIVADNVIRQIGLDFLAATAINNLTHYGFQALHNDIADSQYMGFHQRTAATTIAASAGTGGTVASFNRISLANNASRYGVGDGAYLYSDGVWPNSTFQGNDINGIDAPTGIIRGMMYDDDSYGLIGLSNVVRNVSAGLTGYLLYTSLSGYENYLVDSFGDATANNFNAVYNINFTTFSGTPPAAARAIIDNAGLEPAYTNLLQFSYSGANLAQGKTAWASSQSGTNTAGAAVDWNFSTVWQPVAGDTNQCWWAVDLGSPYVIRRIEIAADTTTNQPDARSNFRVDAANDAAFSNSTVLSEQNSVPFAYRRTGLANSWVKYPNQPQAFRYLRVIKTAPGTLSFSEVRVYGYALAASPVLLTAVAGPNSLALSWPADHLGWQLQVQTNGLGTNWVDWPGSAAVTATNIPIVPGIPSVFFRLASP